MHLARGADVVIGRDCLQFVGREHRRGLVPGPREVVPVVVEPDISVLAGAISTRVVRKHLSNPGDDPPGHIAVLVLSEQGVGVQIHLEKLRVVVRHLLEMGDDPPGIHAVAMKSASELVVHATSGHSLQGAVDDGANMLRGLIVPAVQQQRERTGVGKLGLTAESAVDRVEDAGHLSDRILQQLGRLDRPVPPRSGFRRLRG